MKIIKINLYIFLCLLFLGNAASGQSLRNLVNGGVDKYKEKKFSDSEAEFKKGIQKAPDNFYAKFNLGDAQYKQQRYDEAIKSYQQALKAAKEDDLKAKTYHNIGNSLLKSQKIEESIESYKKSLKLNPKDTETKYNLSYALNLLKQQQDNKQQNKDKNKNDKQNQNKNQQDKNKQDQNKDNKDQQNKNQNQNKDQQSQQDNTKQDKQNQQPKQDKNKMSKEEAQRILNALKNNELDLQKKLRKFEGKRVATSKDW